MTTQVVVRMPVEKKKRLQKKSKETGVSMQVALSYLSDMWLDDQMEFRMVPTQPELVESAEDYEAWVQGRRDLKNGDVYTLDDIRKIYE